MSGFYDSDDIDIFDTVASSAPVWGGTSKTVEEYTKKSGDNKVIKSDYYNSLYSYIEVQNTQNKFLLGSSDIFASYYAVAPNTGFQDYSNRNTDTNEIAYYLSDYPGCKHVRVVAMAGAGGGGGGYYYSSGSGGGGGGSGAYVVTGCIDMSSNSYKQITVLTDNPDGRSGGDAGKSGKNKGKEGNGGESYTFMFVDSDDTNNSSYFKVGAGGGGGGGSSSNGLGGDAGTISTYNNNDAITYLWNKSGNSASDTGGNDTGKSGAEDVATNNSIDYFPPFNDSTYYNEFGKGGNGGKSGHKGGLDGQSGYYIIYFLNGDIDAVGGFVF